MKKLNIDRTTKVILINGIEKDSLVVTLIIWIVFNNNDIKSRPKWRGLSVFLIYYF